MKILSIYDLFLLGDHHQALKKTAKTDAEISWQIGSASFLGQLDVAEILFKKMNTKSSIAHFFMGLSYSRISKYANARYHFGQNLKLLTKSHRNNRDKKISNEELFFIYQGIAFYRRLTCRFAVAIRWSELSFQSAYKKLPPWFEILSHDLKGQCLIDRGQISQGMQLLKRAHKIAIENKYHGLQQALDVTMMNTKAQHGDGGLQLTKQIEKFILEMSDKDNYSRAILLIHLATQYLLQGKIEKSQQMLTLAYQRITRHNIKRLQALVLFKFSYLNSVLGKKDLAFDYLEKALSNIETQIDLVIYTKILGLKYNLLTNDSEYSHLEKIKLLDQIKYLTLKTGHAISGRILNRMNQSDIAQLPNLNDPLGDLKDLLSAKNKSELQNIHQVLESGYHFLLTELLPIKSKEQHILMDILPKKIACFNFGEIYISDNNLSQQLKNLILILKNSNLNKEQLVQQLWGYEYDPARHDSMIYTMISRLRLILGPYQSWLVQTSGTYSFNPNVSVSTFEHQIKSKIESKNSNPLGFEQKMNFRQLKILEYCKNNEFIDIQIASQLTKSSKPTSTRDLAHLVKSEYLLTLGKARATKYILKHK